MDPLCFSRSPFEESSITESPYFAKHFFRRPTNRLMQCCVVRNFDDVEEREGKDHCTHKLLFKNVLAPLHYMSCSSYTTHNVPLFYAQIMN